MVKDFNHQQYQNNYEQYLESNTSGKIGGKTPKERVELFSRYVPSGSRVFEIGSGGGEDALELVKKGYIVTASDYVEEFVNILKEKGLEAVVFDAKKDVLHETYDAIYANAVFVHFTSEEITDFLQRIKPMLMGPKVIFATVINGEGYERSARSRGFERDFYYYSLESLTKLFEHSSYKVLASDDSDPKWLQIIAGLVSSPYAS